jgi:hypothetical protein
MAMDNRINENRKKIRLLRAQMLDAEAVIRGQIGRDEDYTENSVGLMAMRAEMSELSKERARLGDDKEPILVERLMHQRRPPAARPVVISAKRVIPARRQLAAKRA